MTNDEIRAMCAGFQDVAVADVMAEKVIGHQRKYKTFQRGRQYLQYALSLTDKEMELELERPISRWNRQKSDEVALMYEQRSKAYRFKGQVAHMLKIGFSEDELVRLTAEAVEYVTKGQHGTDEMGEA